MGALIRCLPGGMLANYIHFGDRCFALSNIDDLVTYILNVHLNPDSV